MQSSRTFNSSPGADELEELLDNTYKVGSISDRITRHSLSWVSVDGGLRSGLSSGQSFKPAGITRW